MRLAARPVTIGLPVLLTLALAAFLALWLWGSGGSTGLTDTGKTTGTVEYWLTGADGVLKEHGILTNATTSNLLADAEDRLSAAGTTAATDIYTNISLCTTNPNSGAANGFTPTVTCTLSTVVGTNPVLGTITAGAATYDVDTTFTATGATTILELQLSKNLVASTAPANTDLGAARDVSITLASADTLAITWTITIA